MVPTPRTEASNRAAARAAKATLEILPSTKFVVFNGGEHEAVPAKLTGVVRLTTTESMSILRPKVRLEGKRKISWCYLGGIAAGEVTDKRAFWNQEQKLGGIESAHKIKAGVIEWPFEFELSPSMPESVEGLRETYIVYHLHASVSRPGWNAKDVLAQEHIRIVRTLGQDSMEMTRSRVNADIWANKIAYSISIPTDAIVFGTSVTADVELSPIKKGLRIGKVELRLMETVVKRIQGSEVPDARGDRTKSEEVEVAKEDMEFPEYSKVTYEDETPENPMLGDEMYRFKACLPLPKSLNHCRQDVDSHQINITHRFKLMVNLHNPEGHISQLVCRLPLKLFISPNLPVDESNQVCSNLNGLAEESLNNRETSVVAPPEYGRHQLDQIFSDIDPAGYMSRAPSNPGTPSGLNTQSREGSSDNLASLNGVTNGIAANGGELDNQRSASPSTLHSRLADLQEREGGGGGGGSNFAARTTVAFDHSPAYSDSPAPEARDQSPENSHRPPDPAPLRSGSSYFSGSAPMSRQASEEGGGAGAGAGCATTEVQRSDYNMDNLTRVPSYGAALRTPGHITPFTDGPPSYIEATSRPPSPGSTKINSNTNTISNIQRPGPAHVRNNGANTPGSQSSQQTLTSDLGSSAALGVVGEGGDEQQQQQPPPPRPTVAHRNSSTAAEDDARLRMLRART